MSLTQCTGCDHIIDSDEDTDCFSDERVTDRPNWEGALCVFCRERIEEEEMPHD